MPSYYASRITNREEYGEQLVCPNFHLREPIFTPSRSEHDGEEWGKLVNGIQERGARCSGQ